MSCKSALLIVLTLCIAGCTKKPVIEYNPDDFVVPNRVVTKTIRIPTPEPPVQASFSAENDPAVLKAYETYTKNGIAKSISSEGFKTIAYDPESHPIVDCEPLHLCVIQLERQERINNIDLGDSSHWVVGTTLVGTGDDGSIQVVLKPKLYDIATDMVVSTNKRTYNIGLVSKRGSETHVVSFYYPEETLHASIEKSAQLMSAQMSSNVVAENANVDVSNIHFNYALSGDYPVWRPVRVFDDGHKTYIQMPSITKEVDLPILYLVKNKSLALVNSRYLAPYFVVDGLFERAFLVSGKGSNQIKVRIDHPLLANNERGWFHG